jgi:hypothetical protein
MNTYAKVIFLHQKKGLTIREIAEMLTDELTAYDGFNEQHPPIIMVQRIIANEINQVRAVEQLVFRLEMKELRDGQMVSRAVKVIDKATGNVYDTIKDAAFWLNINPATLSKKLSGYRTNNTTIQYYIAP